jgi:hypothetical protein
MDNKIIEFNEINTIPVDFEDIMQLMVSYIKERLPNKWTDFLESNSGIELMEVFAFEATKLIFLLNKNINEAFLPTARTRDAIYNLVKTIGYKIKGPNPASTYCIFNLNFDDSEIRTNSIYLGKYTTKLTSIDGKEFYLAEDIEFPIGITQIKGLVKAGIVLEDTFISSGQLRYPYITSSFPVSSIEYVTVNGQFWEYSDFMNNINNKYAYTIEYDNDFRAKIIFGNGVYGKIPESGSEIVVGYTVCDGINSNSGANMITNLATQIYYENAEGIVTPVTITVNNPEAAIGGDDPETPNEARSNAPSVFRTQWRAVTKQDFYDLLRAERGIYKLQVLDRYDNANIGMCEVKIVIIPTGGGLMNTYFKETIINKIEERKHITSEVGFLDPNYVPIDVEATITIKKGTNSTTTKISATKLIKNYLSYKNRDFGQMVSAKDIEILLRSIIGVERVDNINILEKKYTYLYETFDPTQIHRDIIQDIKEKKLEGIILTEENYESRYRTIKINDTSKLLQIGDTITICRNRNIVHKNIIESIDGSIYLLRNPIVDEEDKYIKLLDGDQVYLALLLKEDFPGGTKEFTVNNMNKLHNILTECTVYFEDYEGITEDYLIAFTDIDKFILSERMERPITARKTMANGVVKRGYVYIKGKDTTIRAETNITRGSILFNITQTPRFSTNTFLYLKKNPTIKYYVTDISGKTIMITPGILEDVKANEIFIVDSDEINLNGNEICDIGGNIDLIINSIT